MEEWLVKHYKHTKNKDILERFNLTSYRLHLIAKELGLEKSPQFIKKCSKENSELGLAVLRHKGWPPKGYIIPNQEKKIERLKERKGKKHKKSHVEKFKQTFNNLIDSERRRILFGIEQRTKRKLVRAPKQKVHCRYKLRKYGYHVEKGASIAYYDENTNRNKHFEELAAKYKIRIEPVQNIYN